LEASLAMYRIVDSGSSSTECLGLRSAARKKANQVCNPASRKERVIPSPERFSKAVSNPDGALLVSWTSVRYYLRISTTSAKRFRGLSPFGTVGLIGTESSAIVGRRLTRKVRARRNARSGLVKRAPREARALSGVPRGPERRVSAANQPSYTSSTNSVEQQQSDAGVRDRSLLRMALDPCHGKAH